MFILLFFQLFYTGFSSEHFWVRRLKKYSRIEQMRIDEFYEPWFSEISLVKGCFLGVFYFTTNLSPTGFCHVSNIVVVMVTHLGLDWMILSKKQETFFLIFILLQVKKNQSSTIFIEWLVYYVYYIPKSTSQLGRNFWKLIKFSF